MKNTMKSHAWIHGVFIGALLIALSLPFSTEAASPRYGRNASNGAVYLLPNNSLGGGTFANVPSYNQSSSGSYSGPYASGAGNLSVSCVPSKRNAVAGETIAWISYVSGGSGSYLYTWSGSDGLAGNTSAVQKAYATHGEKIATLTVTSGNRLITVSCGSVIVVGGSFAGASSGQGGFGASCYATPERAALGESVTWLSIVYGVNASTTYSWDGTDGLTGDRPMVSKTYTAPGNKIAMLSVSNGSTRIAVPCTNAAAVGMKAPVAPQKPAAPVTATPAEAAKPAALDVAGLCAPSSSRASTDERVEWKAVAVGGTGAYQFLWAGDEALAGEGATTSKQYKEAGTKRAAVKIMSGEKIATVACYPIDITKGKNGFTASAIFSWIKGTVGVILAAILAIFLGVFIAVRKRSKEEADEEERDHVR